MPASRSIPAFLVAAALSQGAAAQVAPPPVAPPIAWKVSADPQRGRVLATKTSLDGQTIFRAGCDKARPGFAGNFSGSGRGLQTVYNQTERVLFMVKGDGWREAFSATMRYMRDSSWDIDRVLSPVFVNSFSRGGTISVLNSRMEEVFTFDLTGSTAAARTMREVCGFD